MSLEFVQRKLQEIRQTRSRLLAESNFEQSHIDYKPDSRDLGRNLESISELKVAAIMDEFTYQAFKPEFNLMQLTPGNWEDELKEFQPDLFFLESAWLGLDGLWKTKISNLSQELIEIIGYCKINNIPIAFWNKEDPIHFETFFAIAKMSDYIFTTDIDCIKKYKTLLKHERVFLLPFAAQTKFHNPIEKYERENKYCFAGAYYKRYPERIKDFETIINTISKKSEVVIYDRNYYKRDPNYRFPKKYRRYIAGHLKSDEIDKAYKGYRFNISMNSVKYSQTMCARRVFELLASNTVTISNYSTAIRNLFGDLIVCTDNAKQLETRIKFLNDEEYYRKLRLAGLRKVLSQHTYSKRAKYLVSKIYNQINFRNQTSVAIISVAFSMEEIKRIIDSFNRQNYGHLSLYIISSLNVVTPNGAAIVHHPNKDWISDLKKTFDYIAFFSSKDYYGPNYIYDFMTAREYIDADVMTKSAYFINSQGEIRKCNEGAAYTTSNYAKVRRSVIKCQSINDELLMNCVQSIDEMFLETACISIDEYNYCMNYTGKKCPPVDDLKITDVGVSIDQLYQKAEKIHNNHLVIPALIPTELINVDSGCHVNKSNVLLCTNRYPSYDNLYQYPFVHRRVVEYRKRGLIVDVFKCNEQTGKRSSEFCGIDVMTGYHSELTTTITYGGYDTILVHFLTESLWQGLKHTAVGKRIIVWIHGAEIQPWWRRKFNYQNKSELELAQILTDRRMAFWKGIFQLALTSDAYCFHFVFVSNYLVREVFEDLELELPKEIYSVIPNFISTELFLYQDKHIDQRKRILSIRPFASPTYANDLTVKAILELSREKFFKDLEFRIIGQGKLFYSTLKPLRKFKNVKIEEKFLRQEEIAELHREYGVFLVPTRMDTQGVSRDEAMSSGLVPITNSVAAVPEFVDQSSAILAEPEDFKGLAEGIKKLYYEPELFSTMSKNAAELIRKQRGAEQTICKEMKLILSSE